MTTEAVEQKGEGWCGWSRAGPRTPPRRRTQYTSCSSSRPPSPPALPTSHTHTHAAFENQRRTSNNNLQALALFLPSLQGATSGQRGPSLVPRHHPLEPELANDECGVSSPRTPQGVLLSLYALGKPKARDRMRPTYTLYSPHHPPPSAWSSAWSSAVTPLPSDGGL